MVWFASKKVKWRRKMQNHGECKASFDQLGRAIGREEAKRYVELIYQFADDKKWKSDVIKPNMVKDWMDLERDNTVNKRQYFNSLAPRTKSGELGTLLNSNLRDETDYYKNPNPNGPTARDLAIDKAANWICGGFVAALGSTRALLEEYIPVRGGDHGKAGAALGRTPQHMRTVHSRACPDVKPYRFVYAMAKTAYPSTVGASVLLDEIFQMTAGQSVWPPFGNSHWESIAMFYLASIVTVQGFTDGNKRAGHLAYSIVLIKGTHDFKVPTTDTEGELFKMKG